LFEQPGDIERNRKIDAFFVKTENAGRSGVFAAVSGVDYDDPRNGEPNGELGLVSQKDPDFEDQQTP
jgi:hypothetical protein